MPPELHFLRPYWFIALLPLAGLLFALWRRPDGDSAWRRVVDAHLLPYLLSGTPGRSRRLPLVLLGLGWLVAAIALAGPVWERLPQPVFGTSAKRVILLDLSPSMNAADVAPSRLARARFEVLDLLRATREGQVALIAFGPEPFVVSPLTGDAQTIAAQVPRLSTDLIPVPGPRRTERALEQAGQLLRQAGSNGGEVVLIADGIDGAPAIAAARALAESGVRVSVLGVGTAQGAPEPGPDGGFSNDRTGTVRIARLDRKGLEDLAAAGNGLYLEPDPGDRDTRALMALSANIGQQETMAQPGLLADQWREEGPWLLLALIPLAALAFRRGWLLPVLVLAIVLPPDPASALSWDDLWARPDQQAARSLAAGDGAAAAARFEDPAWRAAARYRTGDYTGALEDLTGATGPEADYNRGNALIRQGRLDEAIAAYERTLAQVPKHADASENLALARRLKAQQDQSKDKDQEGQGKGQQGQDKGQKGEGKDRQEKGQDQAQQGQGQSGDKGAGGGSDKDRASQGSDAGQGTQGDQGRQAEGDKGDSQGSDANAGKDGAQAAQRHAGRTGKDRGRIAERQRGVRVRSRCPGAQLGIGPIRERR